MAGHSALIIASIALAIVIASCSSGSDDSVQDGVSATIAATAGPQVFTRLCGQCHLPPRPDSHLAAEWPVIVERMQRHIAQQGKTPLSADAQARILAYLMGPETP